MLAGAERIGLRLGRDPPLEEASILASMNSTCKIAKQAQNQAA